MEIVIRYRCNIRNLTDQIMSELTHDDLIDLVKYIDIGMQDWDFTKELFLYFQEQMAILAKEEASDGVTE